MGGAIQLATNYLNYTATYLGTNPAVQSLSMTNEGAYAFTYSNTWAYSEGASGWLTILPNAGSVAPGGAEDLTNAVAQPT